MKIEVLYFDDCPHHKPAADRVRDVLREEGVSAEVTEVRVPDEATARRLGFLGSPSIRIDGLDIEPAARPAGEFGLMCRTYLDQGRRVGTPPRELIQNAVREAAGSRLTGCFQAAGGAVEIPGAAAPRPKWMLGASLAAALAASLCCILPIATAVTGVGVLAAGARFEPWRPYLLGVTGLLLGAGLVLAYRGYRKSCVPGSLCAMRPLTRWNLIALGVLAGLVAALAAFPYYSGVVAEAVIRVPVPAKPARPADLATVTFRIPDMDCPACAVSLAATLKRLPGVAEAKLDVDRRQAVVAFDSAAQNAPALRQVITDAGFHVASASRP